LTISPDGKLLLFMRNLGVNHRRDVWAIPLAGDAKPFAVLQSEFNEEAAEFSPDGRWLAYVSDDLGSRQIYVEPFPSTGARIRVSPTTGTTPSWRDDGAALFYVTLEDALMTVDVTAAGGTMRVGTPRELYTARDLLPVNRNLVFDPPRKRVLMLRTSFRPEPTPVTVILNWTSAVRSPSAPGR
jgi:Tol biopolymer transport system component